MVSNNKIKPEYSLCGQKAVGLRPNILGHQSLLATLETPI